MDVSLFLHSPLEIVLTGLFAVLFAAARFGRKHGWAMLSRGGAYSCAAVLALRWSLTDGDAWTTVFAVVLTLVAVLFVGMGIRALRKQEKSEKTKE